MFDQPYESSRAIARHEAAPYARERSRYLEYCRQRGETLSTVMTKASDLLWIVRQLSGFAHLHVTVEEVRAVVAASGDDDVACHRHLDSPARRKRLLDTARSWLRYLGYLREPAEQIPFQSRLDEYCEWAKHERGLSDATIYSFRQRVKQFLQW